MSATPRLLDDLAVTNRRCELLIIYYCMRKRKKKKLLFKYGISNVRLSITIIVSMSGKMRITHN